MNNVKLYKNIINITVAWQQALLGFCLSFSFKLIAKSNKVYRQVAELCYLFH